LIKRERNIAERITVSLDALTALLKSKYTEAQKIEAQRKIDALESERRQVQAEIRERRLALFCNHQSSTTQHPGNPKQVAGWQHPLARI
jgi:hypothetical protein